MEKALKTMIENMPEKTGKSLEEWATVLSKNVFSKHSLAVKYLKEEHGVSHGFANTIVTLTKENKNDEAPLVDLVAAQYAGKESLIPIYDALITLLNSFGDDLTITPKKGSVSIIRKRQFALIKPATKTRIDLGLKLKNIDPEGCLEPSGPFGTMCTHRIKLESVSDINAQVSKWLALAYEKSV